MFFSENSCCLCQTFSSTLPVTLLFLHPLAEMLKCCVCGSKGASMNDFHDLQLKEQLLLQQKCLHENTVFPVEHANAVGMGRLRVFVFFQQALFLHEKPLSGQFDSWRTGDKIGYMRN
uniref:Uncharacterized protein n=1 Tax=Eutreptiella gymnastica TaxID=73025 RepID=A0A7S4LKD7_9EUGL